MIHPFHTDGYFCWSSKPRESYFPALFDKMVSLTFSRNLLVHTGQSLCLKIISVASTHFTNSRFNQKGHNLFKEGRFSFLSNPVLGAISPTEDIWQCLETFVVVTAGDYYWHLVGGGQRCWKASYNTWYSPHNQEFPAQNVHCTEGEKPWCNLRLPLQWITLSLFQASFSYWTLLGPNASRQFSQFPNSRNISFLDMS